MNAEIKNTLQEIGNVIKQLFAEAPAPVEPAAPAAAFSPYQLQDGTAIEVEALEVGKLVKVNGAPAPAGEHILSDGTKIEVDAAGIITEISAPEPEMPAEASAAAPQFNAEEKFAELQSAYDQKFAEQAELINKQNQAFEQHKQEFAKLHGAFKQLIEVVGKLAEAPVAEPVTPAPNNFSTQKQDLASSINSILKNK